MFKLADKIDRANDSHAPCTLIDKLGRYHHGHMTDSWVRLSGGKLRGKVIFLSQEKGEIEIDCNDILDIVFNPDSKGV